MSEGFKREERYIVIKRNRLSGVVEWAIRNYLSESKISTVECVVVEHDWPEYEPTWEAIRRRMCGEESEIDCLKEDLLESRGDYVMQCMRNDELITKLRAYEAEIEGLKEKADSCYQAMVSARNLAMKRIDIIEELKAQLSVALEGYCYIVNARWVDGFSPADYAAEKIKQLEGM